ncbi:unnamed protein product [Cylicostephanus goldi]|uniref:Uncharacterized protein n=1 Tax=Cylicostephanus goldi TaxID=71465 RepID=A0A3P7QA97_CYLGO|nr:unnamed protein product [Cylicostephanus goldi]
MENSQRLSKSLWIDDCFVFTTASKKLNYNGGEIVTNAHVDRPLYLVPLNFVLGSRHNSKKQRTGEAHFFEKQGFKRQALAVSQDPNHK